MKRIMYNKIEINGLESTDVEKLISKNKGDRLIIPEIIDGMSVEGIKSGCFEGIVGIKEIVFPASLIYVDYEAISNCDVERLVFKKNLEHLDVCKLRTNRKLNHIEIESGTKYFETFQGNLYSANRAVLLYGFNNTVSEDTMHIGNHAFSSSEIKSIIIPKSVKTIGSEAFMKCNNLKEVEFVGQELTHIGKYAFAMCKQMSHISIPGSVLQIGGDAFRGSNLTSLVFEDRKKDNSRLEIGGEAFIRTKIDTVDFSKVKNLEIRFGAFQSAKVENLTLCGNVGISRQAFKRCNIEAITLKSIDVYFTGTTEDILGNHTPELVKLIEKHNRQEMEVSFILHNDVWIEDRFW